MTRQLLFSVTKKDLVIQTFRAGGKGGQNQNKRDTGVRIIHPESGARAEAREHRTQGQNKKAAFRRMIETKEFKKWHRIKTAIMLGLVMEVEEKVDQLMDKKNIRVQVRQNGKWVDVA